MLESILEVLSLTQWKKKRDILRQLDFQMSERKFRKLIEQNNKLFGCGQVEYYIAHSCKGYKKTFNWEEMQKSISDNRKRAITMLIDCSKAEKAFENRNQIKLELDIEK